MPSLATASKYNRAALRVAVAQICQSLGWQSASSMALDVLVDVMQNHLQELAKLTGRYANQFDRTLANLDDLGLALRDLGVPATDLEDYMYTVEPTSFPHRVPRLPVPRPTNLSFLKPGSQEIVTRPIHVYEHLPPMHPDTADEGGDSQPADSSGGRMAAGSASSPGLKRPGDSLASEAKRGRFLPEEEGRPMREILSVMMTTSGFISPAREGKLPETRLPEPLDDYGDDYRHVKTRKQRADTYRRLSERENERRNRDRERERDRWLREDDLFDIIDVKVEEEEGSAGSSPEKLPTATESAKLKPFKKHVKTEPGSGRSAGGELPPPVVSPRGRMGEEKAKINKIKKKKPKPADVKSSKLSIFKKKIAKKKLDKSAVKLEKSAVKPEKSAVKLDKSAEKPSTSTEKPPSTLTEKPPSTSTEKPPSTSTSTEKPSTSTGKPSTSTGKPKTSAVPPVKKRPKKKLPPMLPDEPQLFSSPAKPIEVAPSKPADPPAAKAKGADKTSKSADKTTSKSADKTTSKSADRAPAKHAERTPTKAAQRPAPKPAVKAERVAARPRSPSPPVVSTSSLTPPGTPGTPRAPEPRRKPSEVSLSDLSPRSDDSGTPDRPRTPELQVRREPPPPPPDPAALLNNPLIPRFPFPFAVGAGPEGVPPPPFPGLPGLRPPPSLFLNTPPAAAAAAKARAKSPEERREKPRPLAARLLDPRRSPSDASDGSRSPTPDLGAMTPLKRLEMAERAEKALASDGCRMLQKKEKEHKKNKKDKKEKKKKDKKDKDKKELKTDKKEKKKKEEKDTPPAKVQDDRDETVPKLTLRLASQDSPDSRSPSPEPPPPKLVIKPVREQPEPSTSAPVGRPKKKPGKKKAEEPPPALLKPPKKEKEKKKSPVVKPKKTVSPPKAQPAAVIAETVGSFLDSEGNRIWICPECGRQDDGSPMIGCDGCDDWYHWVCVGIQVPPGDEDWFCPRCIVKMQSNVKQKGKGRGKKK